MCGRYTYKLTWAEIVNLYRLTLPDEEPPGLKPSYNVAPTHVMPIIRPAPVSPTTRVLQRVFCHLLPSRQNDQPWARFA
jgi:putative SOS response-associated peptidase YedK